MKKFFYYCLAVIAVGCIYALVNSSAFHRAFKSLRSDLGGGLNRTVTVYSYNGEKIASWSGKFDVSENDRETWFDIGNKRVIIQNGIIINEEND